MNWSWVDALNISLDMFEAGEITKNEVEKTANELWAEMQVIDEENL